MKPIDKDIEKIIDECRDLIDKGKSKFRGMTYEEGVKAALEWVTGMDVPDPMED